MKKFEYELKYKQNTYPSISFANDMIHHLCILTRRSISDVDSTKYAFSK